MNLNFKKWVYGCLTFLSAITINNSNAQCVEHVNNGSFESMSATPPCASSYAYGQYFYMANGWDNWTGTTGSVDLFSVSSSTAGTGWGGSANNPCNFAGYQAAHTGNAYAGLLTIEADGTPAHNPINLEYMESFFSANLTAGQIYEVSLWVSRADLSDREINGLGVWMKGYPGSDPASFNCPVASLNNDAWTRISFPYCADGTESSIIIGGNSTTWGNTLTVSTVTCSGNAPNYTSSYIYIDDISVKDIAFTVPSQTLCAKYTGTFTAVPTCSTIVTSALTYTWNYGDGTTVVTTNTLNVTTHSYAATPSGVYTGSLTVGTGSCSNTYTYNVTVPNVGITITTNTNTICNGITSFTAMTSPTGTYTYTWTVKDAATGTVIPSSNYTITSGNTNTPAINFANINQNVNICVSITSTLGCQYSQCYFIPSCCATPTNVIKHSNKTFTVNTTISTASVSLGGTITVNNNTILTLLQTNAQLDPNTKIVLNGNAKIQVINSYIHGCNFMWDGIYANTTNLISIVNTRVEDAQRVVVDSLGTASINLVNNYLNKNWIGVHFKKAKTSTSSVTFKNNFVSCSTVPITGALPYKPTATNLANAATLGAYPTTFLMAPYNTQKSFTGICMNTASHTGKANSAITIGGNNNEENVFDKMQTGAFVSVSNSNFQNNVFQNIKNTIAPSSLNSNAGVLVWGPVFGGGPYYTQVGGASTNFKNTFKDNDFGIASMFPTALLITNNRFETQNTGIYVVWNNSNLTAQTSQNKFINNQVGINYNENTLINATISSNWFDNTSAQGTYANNFAIRTTESVPASGSPYAAYNIYNNYINGYYNGVYTSNTYKTYINDNEIHMRADNTSGNFQSAIQIISSNDNDVYNNTSDYPNGTKSNWWQYNIFTAGSTVPKIHCNNTNYGGVGIIANGLNYTAAGNGIYGNAMSNHEYGFWLNANGEIGDQYYLNGGTNYSADNSWTSCTYETFANTNCNQISAEFYTRSTNPYKINNPTQTGTGLLLTGINSTGYTGACYGGIATPTLNLKVAGVGAQKLVMQKADDIATGNIQFTENNASLKQIARKQLLSNLNLAQIDPSFSNDVSSFANNAKQSTLGRFFLVDSLINTGDTANLTLASLVNSNISTSNDVDVTQQQFNTEYINYLKNKRKVNAASILAFENMAYQCPSIYGHAVYQARSVLFNLTKKQYVNTCENGNTSSKRFASAVMNEVAINVRLFPNPSNGNITLQTADDLSYTITVYNLLGEKVFESSASNNQSLNLAHLSSATYIVHIQHNSNLIKTERISIVH